MVILVFGMEIDFQVYDSAVLQGLFDGIGSDPRVEPDGHLVFQPRLAQASAKEPGHQEIGRPAEVSEKVSVPVAVCLSADVCADQKELLRGHPGWMRQPLLP